MIRYIPKEGLNRVWQFYREGILQIMSFGGVSFIPEDVYLHLRLGKAQLYRVGDEGFFVVERVEDLFTNEFSMNVWLMWFKPGHGIPYKPELIAYLDQLKVALGCNRITFTTMREAWVRMLGEEFKQTMMTLER